MGDETNIRVKDVKSGFAELVGSGLPPLEDAGGAVLVESPSHEGCP